MADPLQTVVRLRRLASDEAKRGLAAALQALSLAEAAARAAEQAIHAEGQKALDLDSGDGLVEAYAAWLPAGRARATAARAAVDHQSGAVARARAELTLTRAAAEAAEQLVQRNQAEQAILVARKSQADMDEIASRQKPLDP